MTPILAVLAALAAALVIIPLDAFALALWRRWLGGMGGHFPRSLKIAALVVFIGAQQAIAFRPLYLPSTWTSGDTALAAVLGFACAALAVIGTIGALVSLCLWFVVAHNNGGPEGKDGPVRYGNAGRGYPLFFLLRERIPEVRLLGCVVVSPRAWTEAAELWLGGYTGLVISPPLAVGIALNLFFLLTLAH